MAPFQRPDRTLGGENAVFWSWCNREELRLQCCEDCGAFRWPVADLCAHCGTNGGQWVALSGRGTVIASCRFEHDYYRGALPLPHDCILVRLEEGPMFVSNPLGFSCDGTEAGKAVIVKFVDATDSAGPFKLPVFAPAETNRI